MDMLYQLYSEKEITLEDAKDHNLAEDEYLLIRNTLNRNPTFTELGIFSGMWSEHCSYKNSILLLKELPKESPQLIAKAGEENAGAMDIGNELVLVYKIESHNHPSAVEPFQGAATGVGGIMRDIFTMGARPICSLNSLRFGPLENSRNRYLFRRVVEGIAFYGNCLGIAVAGGEVFFDPTYTKNCLVNAMAVGIALKKYIAKARAQGAGNPVYYVGAETGRDGIHGASFASQDLTEETQSQKSAVQVGDPFKEKLLMEATLEAIRTGYIIGIQDMGAAGLTSSSSEMAAKGGTGIDLFLDKVPLREKGMIPYEIMLSESQERMLMIIDKDHQDKVERIFEKWGLHAIQIGVVTDTKRLRVFFKDKLYADLPVDLIVNAPKYQRETREPSHIREALVWNSSELKIMDSPEDLERSFYELLASPNISSKRVVYEQYDSEVGLVSVQKPGGQSGLIRISSFLLENLELANYDSIHNNIWTEEEKKEILKKGLSVSTDCNARYVYLNPFYGTQLAVFESARNVATSGAEPLGITNNLNFANPYKPENYYMFQQSVRGMAEACKTLGIPVTGGNVSFYNESEDGPILPTPTIGMVGYMEDVSLAIYPFFKILDEEQILYLVGNFEPTFGGSEYLWIKKQIITGKIPEVVPDVEKNLIFLLRESYRNQILESAADLSLGGLAIGLFRMAYNVWNFTYIPFELLEETLNNFYKKFKRWDLIFFGETSATVLVSVRKSKNEELLKLFNKYNLQFFELGKIHKFENFSLKKEELNLLDKKMDFRIFSANASKSIDLFEDTLEKYLKLL